MSRVISSLVFGLTTRMRMSVLQVMGIVVADRLRIKKAVLQVFTDSGGVALAGVAVAAGRGPDRPDRVAGNDLAVGDLRRQRLLAVGPRIEQDGPGRAVLAAEEAERRPLVAVRLDREAAGLRELRVANR